MASTYREAACPYPGLRPFQSYEADIFFGREEHTDRLLEILQAQRFLAVIGPSGSGKSSLVRAGLLPALAMGSLGSGSEWRVALIRPGDRPIERLASSLLQAGVLAEELGAAADDDRVDAALVATLAAELRRGPLGLLHVVRSAWLRNKGRSPNLLVLVDQFEELFTYADASGEDDSEAEAFVQLLLAARAEPDARIHVALTMRTDFLGHCVRFVELPDAINRAQYLTPRLTRVQMERAIGEPAQVFGGEVEGTLVAELINATGHNSDQLPLVQHALSRMWPLAVLRDPLSPRITWADAQAVGGVQGALGQHAESLLGTALAALPAEQAGLPEALLKVITSRRSGGQDVRHPRTLARITRACGLEATQWPLPAGIVAAFAAPDASLLQHGDRLGPDSVVDLSHEALIRQWPRLAEWVADDARRGADYRRWAERAADHAEGTGSLLDGADLLRAVEWWNPEPQASGRNWQPSAPWAERYAASADTASAQAEFERTVGFITRSREAQQHAAADRERAQAEARTVAVEREHARETSRVLRLMKRAFVASGLALVLALAAATVAWQQSRQAAEAAATNAELQRLASEAKANEALRTAELGQAAERQRAAAADQARTAAEQARVAAERARMTAEALRAEAKKAEALAKRFAALAKGREEQAVAAFEEIKRQQALAEEQRLLAEQERKRAEFEASRANSAVRRLAATTAQDVLNSIYDTGLMLDGVFGAMSSHALKRLQEDAGMEVTGQLDEPSTACVTALARLNAAERKAALAGTCGPNRSTSPRPAGSATLAVQKFLAERGFDTPLDGQLGMPMRATLVNLVLSQ